MRINDQHYRTIWLDPNDPATVLTFDQRALPFELIVEPLRRPEEAATAILEMHVRGAPLIGATAAYGMYLAALHARGSWAYLEQCAQLLGATRPTAVDLFHALERMLGALRKVEDPSQWIPAALAEAHAIADESVEQCRQIGLHGLERIRAISEGKGGAPVHILTHCNAGWLACIDHGTATAPIYAAHDAGIPVHVWVDETRPRNQGSKITAFELQQHGVPHTVIADNTGGHLMQHGLVDLVIVGTDRTTRRGDVANKIGTYLKALAAKDNGIPFYVALPSSSLDFRITDGLKEIPIEERNEDEVRYLDGWDGTARKAVLLVPEGSRAANYGFDVTPARLVTGLITERGICPASEEGILELYPEHRLEEGYIKFQAHWEKTVPFAWEELRELNDWRQRCFDRGWIGAYPNGIGFGNISCRKDAEGRFLISGSATGGLDRLGPEHYALVERVDESANALWCSGPVIASSEAMSHAAVYAECPEAGGVIHIHHRKLWEYLLEYGLSTAADAAYGTPEMARSIRELLHAAELKQDRIFAMKGHEEGVFAFGETLKSAFEVLERAFDVLQ